MKRRVFAPLLLCLFTGQGALAERVDNLLARGNLDANALDLTAPLASVSAALMDGKPDTAATFNSQDGAPVDLLFRFDPETVAPDGLIVTLAEGETAPAPQRVDILVSTLSPTSGFVSLRTERIDPLRRDQKMSFRPRAASWVQIRLYPAADSTQISLGDLRLKGVLGPPETTYAFGETPSSAIEIISALEGIREGRMTLTAEEREIFERAGQGALESKDFVSIALLASGVDDPAALESYHDRIDALTAKAKATLAPGTSPAETGSALLTFLHEETFTNGYSEGQTNLSTVLDKGVYNCVSSAVLYNAIAGRLGLDVRAIEVPDHAFSIVYDGLNHMDVETTTSKGFNPARERVAEFEQLTGFRYIPQSNKSKRREIGAAGLAALIYYNHGVTHLREGRYQDALFANFRALSLDPDFASAATNALAALGRWSADLADAGQWEDSTQIAEVAVRLAPEDAGLASNQIAVWQNWALSEVEAGRPETALGILETASTNVDPEVFTSMRIGLLTRPAEALIAAGDWEAALKNVVALYDLLDDGGGAELDDWRRGVFGRWAHAAMDGADFVTASAILSEGLGAFPGDKRLVRTLRYLAQEWSIAEGYDGGLEVLAGLLSNFPDVDNLNESAEAHVQRHIRAGMATTDLADMLTEVAKADALLSDEQAKELAARVYLVYGNGAIDARDWERAAGIYSEGLEKFPDNRSLDRNARYVAQEWQREVGAGDDLAALEAVQRELRRLFPPFAIDPGFGEDEIVRQINGLVRGGKFAEALEKLESAQLLVRPETHRKLLEVIFDRQARLAMDAGDWQGAAETYAEGRLAIGDDTAFSRNIRYITQEWTRAEASKTGVAGVSAAMGKMTALFPSDGKLPGIGQATLERMIADSVKQGDLAQAEEIVRQATSFVPAETAAELIVALYLRRGSKAIDDGDWEAALRAYSEGLAIQPGTRDLRRNIPYVIQEWARTSIASGGSAQIDVDATTMLDILNEPDTINDVLENVLAIEVDGLVSQGNEDGAFDLINQISALPTAAIDGLKERAYDQWARRHMDAKEWDEAIRIYDMGLIELADSRRLKNNRRYAESQK